MGSVWYNIIKEYRRIIIWVAVLQLEEYFIGRMISFQQGIEFNTSDILSRKEQVMLWVAKYQNWKVKNC